jgi:hypothetical protein
MERRSSTRAWDAKDFCRWLASAGMSARVAGDYASRCRRVETALNISLRDATATEARFVQLMTDIQSYAVGVSASIDSARTMTGTLRSAVRRLAVHLHGKKVQGYRRCHGLSRYQ